MDILLTRAAAAAAATTVGFDRGVVSVRAEIEQEVAAHLDARPPPIPITIVVQDSIPGRDRPAGTAHAVLATAGTVDGPFAVVNADDLYPDDAFALLAAQLDGGDEHSLVAFRLGRTVIGTAPVKRAAIEIDGDRLVAIREATVEPGPSLPADDWVSMNMWGFRPSIFEDLERAVTEFLAAGDESEILLPDVVSAIIAGGAAVRVLRSESPCIGITHADDVDVVRRALA
jgi:NDP-sugar pyrophosphorylase family protein